MFVMRKIYERVYGKWKNFKKKHIRGVTMTPTKIFSSNMGQ